MGFGVEAAAEVAQAVADDEVAGAENHVVAGNLVKDGGGDFNGRCLIFNDYERGGIRAVPDNGVAAAAQAVEVHPHFICHQRGGIA